MKLRVNWHQVVASDGAVRVHRNLEPNQPAKCEFGKMVGDWVEYDAEDEVVAAMKAKPWPKYCHCTHCWDGAVIVIDE